MKLIEDLSLADLVEKIAEFGEKPYRAKQIFANILRGIKISDMTDIPASLKESLLKEFFDEGLTIFKTFVSSDGTEKYLFALSDGNIIEGVLMKYSYGNTLCVSTQVGCRMGCRFCASTTDGLIRNLTSGEMLCEVLKVNALHKTDQKRGVTNVVLMGSGEPFDNYDNVVQFIRALKNPDGINISPRNISLSTCGIVPKIYEFAKEGLAVNLCISLHSPFDEKRAEIMPIAKAYKIKEILEAADDYFLKTGRRYHLEYTLISGVNDTKMEALELIKLLAKKACHINLIRLNETEKSSLTRSSSASANQFLKYLTNAGLNATFRRRTGNDIEGACGQLRRRFITSEVDY